MYNVLWNQYERERLRSLCVVFVVPDVLLLNASKCNQSGKGWVGGVVRAFIRGGRKRPMIEET